MRIAFDYDGTITKNPFLFKEIIEAMYKNGHELYIITGTEQKHRKQLMAELNSFGINKDCIEAIFMKPKKGNVKNVTKWKCKVIDSIKIRCFFENREESAIKINNFCTTFKIL